MHTMTDALLDQTKAIAFEDGVKYALGYLHGVYGAGLEETDLWVEYMTKGAE